MSRPMNVKTIQNKFPNPIKADEVNPGIQREDPTAYCVGGAFCFHVQRSRKGIIACNFPGSTYVARLLNLINPRLSVEKAQRHAEHITWQNDQGRFDVAWQELQRALEYGFVKGAV